jgi:hypothetical protein
LAFSPSCPSCPSCPSFLRFHSFLSFLPPFLRSFLVFRSHCSGSLV